MTDKISDDTIQNMKRVFQGERDKFTVKKSQKIKAKEKEIIKQYRDLKEEQRKTGPAPLTPQQEKFVDIYCARYGEKSATQCAIDAGYGPRGAHNRASELLNVSKSPNVVLEIQSRLAMLRDQWDIDKDKHLAMLTKIRDEARIKGQYGVVAKCEELRGKVGGLYIEKSMVMTKDFTEGDETRKIKEIYGSRDDFDKAMLLMGDDLFPDEKSDLYDEIDIELSEKEKQSQKTMDELGDYQLSRTKERNKIRSKKS